jgi:hypothetical protein
MQFRTPRMIEPIGQKQSKSSQLCGVRIVRDTLLAMGARAGSDDGDREVAYDSHLSTFAS